MLRAQLPIVDQPISAISVESVDVMPEAAS